MDLCSWLFADLLEGSQAELPPVKDEPDAIEAFKLFHQYGDLLAEPFLKFRHCFLPDKGIAVCGRLDLCAVDEDMDAGDLTKVFQQGCHFSKGLFGTLGKMERDEPCDGSMIRRRFSLEEVHEVDIPPAGAFNIPAFLVNVAAALMRQPLVNDIKKYFHIF